MAYCNSYWINIVALLAFTSLHYIVGASNHKLSLRLINSHSIFPFRPSQNDDIRAPVMPKKGGALFLVNISIGSPPVPQLLAMDTGSNLIWTRCNCKGCFDPKKSSTYKDVPPNASPCITFDYGGVSSPSAPCPFDQNYLDTSFTRGTLAFETYTFETSSDGTVQVSNAVMGCAHETKPPDFGGILGLIGATPQHLLSLTGNKFSYCIGNISDTQYMYNQLVLGDGAVIQGDSTPMKSVNVYTVSLIGITVGDVSLRIDVQDIIVDSGTTYTHLRKGAYGPLAEQILILARQFFLPRVKVRNAERNLCFDGDLAGALKGFPVVTLHLEGGVDVNLDVESLFRRTTDGTAFCMTFVESEKNILGITAQQYYNVGFDVGAKMISFQRIDCQLLDE